MKEKLENIRNNYYDLNNKLNDINEKIMDEERIHDELSVEFEKNDCELENLRIKFQDIVDKIDEKKNKFVLNKINRHNNIVSLITFIISIGGFTLLASNGLVMGPFFALGGSFGLAYVARMIDVTLFWDKLNSKYGEIFEESDGIKNLRDESDELYVEKLKLEDKYRESQKNIVDHTTILNALKRERHILESEINHIKLNTFDDVIETIFDDEVKLTLK